jgi:hypothetical protein
VPRLSPRADDCDSVNSVSAGESETLKDEPSRAELLQHFIVPKIKGDQASELIGPSVFPTDTTYDKTKKFTAL